MAIEVDLSVRSVVLSDATFKGNRPNAQGSRVVGVYGAWVNVVVANLSETVARGVHVLVLLPRSTRVVSAWSASSAHGRLLHAPGPAYADDEAPWRDCHGYVDFVCPDVLCTSVRAPHASAEMTLTMQIERAEGSEARTNEASITATVWCELPDRDPTDNVRRVPLRFPNT